MRKVHALSNSLPPATLSSAQLFLAKFPLSSLAGPSNQVDLRNYELACWVRELNRLRAKEYIAVIYAADLVGSGVASIFVRHSSQGAEQATRLLAWRAQAFEDFP